MFNCLSKKSICTYCLFINNCQCLNYYVSVFTILRENYKRVNIMYYCIQCRNNSVCQNESNKAAHISIVMKKKTKKKTTHMRFTFQ